MFSDVPPSAARPGKSATLSYVPPQIPTLVDRPPSGEGWLHEIKHDGYRTLLVIGDGPVRAFTRNGYDWTDRYSRVVEGAARLSCWSAMIDGEMIVQDGNGASDFLSLRHAMAREPHRIVFYAFDLLHVDGEDLRALPLSERKAKLAQLLGPADPFSPIQFCDHIEGSGTALFELVHRAGLEGIVSKRADSRYRSGRSQAWRKTKCWSDGEFVVLGTEHGEATPPTVLLARDEDGELTYAGSAFVTLGGPERERFWAMAEELACTAPALKHLRNSKARWCRPELKVRVRYLRGGGPLRHAIVAGLLG